MASVSIIVPVYNVETFILRCIKSIVEQKFDDFELVLVDDGSLDGSGIICDNYALTVNRIVVIHQPNSGVSTARNNGIICSKGNYITFIDSDDWIDGRYLQNLFRSCDKYSAQTVFCDYAIANENSTEEKRAASEEVLCFLNRDAISFYAEKNLKEKNALFRSPWAKMVKRDIVLKHLYPTDRSYAEDAACVYQWIWASERIVHINYCGYYYYQNNKSICHETVGEFFLGNFQTESEWLAFYEENGFPELYKAVSKRYMVDATAAYRDSGKKPVFLKILRKGLRKYGKKAGIDINIEGNSYYYELAYPVEMKFYWYFQALKSKLKRK